MWLKLATLASLIYGISSYFNSELAGKHSTLGLFPLAFGSILVWVVHTWYYRTEPTFYKGNRTRQMGVLMRALAYLGGCIFAATSLGYSTKAHINRGIVVALWTSNVVFTTIEFAIFYGERINWKEAGGMALVISSAVCISHNNSEPTNEGESVQGYYLIVTVVWSIATGFVFSMAALVSKHYTSQCDFTPLKLTVDGLGLSALPMLAGYVYLGGHSMFSWVDDLLGTLVGVGLTLGSITATTALKHGKGGPI